jgi:hypothetical protein
MQLPTAFFRIGMSHPVFRNVRSISIMARPRCLPQSIWRRMRTLLKSYVVAKIIYIFRSGAIIVIDGQ